ncbi:hypothetical protein F0L68_39775 [Solihabitans fulvus]|uniref:Uncharacterized protein n=1 Tax=Solihabitans fulvus TaxID=1892852 RepID=A0A5B2W9T1_9PSEU|nr:hypothetical protein [Solihabitans fulvus]KAA2248691.1 hypothetical protein F0L68_39775 [Solihabitans fulvus]
MKVVLLRGSCGNARTCPNINLSDRDTYVVQGYIVASEQQVSSDEAVVEVPLSLLPELSGATLQDGLALTNHGTLHIRGRQVTDPAVLGELDLPSGENAVEIPRALLPELVMVDA